MYQLSAEKIKENYDKFRSLCLKLGDRTENVVKMVDFFGERLVFCPASAKVDFHCAFPGGLVDHSLRVLQNVYSLSKTYNLSFKKESIIISSLFHDIGKVGSKEHEYYLFQKSDWHRDKGMIYEYNSEIEFMTVQHRSLYLMQDFDIKLNYEEYLAIMLNDGQYVEANKQYAMKEPSFSMILHQADAYSTLWEKNNLK